MAHLAHIGAERDGDTYHSVNVEGTRRAAAAAQAAGVGRIACFSGLGVAHYGMAPRTTSRYFLSKIEAEVALFHSGLDVAVFRPSYIVGPGDGLTKMLNDEVIGNVLRNEEDPKAAVERLIFFANSRGGKDNITVVLVRVVPLDWTPKPSEPFRRASDRPPGEDTVPPSKGPRGRLSWSSAADQSPTWPRSSTSRVRSRPRPDPTTRLPLVR